MTFVLISTLLALLGQSTVPTVQQRSLKVPDVGTIFYGISVPPADDPQKPRPLVLVLHPAANGNSRPYYGTIFMRQIFSPALNDLHPIMVAPDCPGRDWTDPKSEKAVMELIEIVLGEYAIDRHRILVTGYSMGGQGTWFMESRHSDLFTGAIVIAGSARNEPVERLAKIPTYVIHSRDDQVIPFEPAEQTVRELEKLGRPVKFEALDGLQHYEMGGYMSAIRRAGQWMAERWTN